MALNRSIIFTLFLFTSLCIMQAQSLGDILFGPDNKANYMGQYDFKGKRKNGYGIERYRNGSIYVGDFSKDCVSGKGMLLSFEKEIPNVDGAVIYVGSWMDGKKEGKGVCYDSSGNIVFQGTFSKNKPSAAAAKQDNKQFRTIEKGEELYVGEVKGNIPNGYGLKLRKDGAIQFGVFKNGVLKGVCMTLFSPDVWEVGQWVDGKYTAFNNSKAANSRTNSYLALTKEHRAEIRSGLFEATKNFTQAAIETATLVNNVKNGGGLGNNAAGSVEDEKISDGADYDYYLTKYLHWAKKAENTYKDGLSYRLKSNDARWGRIANSTARLLRTQQRMMKQIRTTARKNGHNIPASEFETASF